MTPSAAPRSRRALTIALLVVVVAVVIGVVSNCPADGRRDEPSAPSVAAEPNDVDEASPRHRGETPDSGDAAPNGAFLDGLPRIRGTLVIAPGRDPLESALLLVTRAGGPSTYAVVAPDGTFSARVPEDGEWTIIVVLVNEWEAYVDSWPRAATTAEPMTMRLLEVGRPLLVDVGDARSIEVADVESYRQRHPDELALLAPNPNGWRKTKVVATPRGGIVEVDLDELDLSDTGPLAIRAAGCAWEPLDPDCPDIQTLSCIPAGGLTLAIDGWSVLDRPEIVLDGPGGQRGTLTGTAEQSVAGLREGLWRVLVRRTPWVRQDVRRGGEVYAEGSVTIVAGETSELRLTAEPGDVAAVGDLTGSVHVPDGWVWEGWSKRGDITVEIDGLSAQTIDVERSDSVRFEPIVDGERRIAHFAIRGVPVGEYELLVAPLGWTTSVVVPYVDLELDVPTPAELRVTAVDAATGDEIGDVKVRYFPSIAEAEVPTLLRESMSRIATRDGFPDVPSIWGRFFDTGRGTDLELERIEGTATYSAAVPPGSGTLGVLVRDASAKWGLSRHHREVVLPVDGLVAGERRVITARVERCGAVEAHVTIAGREPPSFSMRFPVRLIATDGTETALRGASVYEVDPGTCRVEIDAPLGWVAVAPETVEIVVGETTSLPIELRPLED